jgi:hypothetical protein
MTTFTLLPFIIGGATLVATIIVLCKIFNWVYEDQNRRLSESEKRQDILCEEGLSRVSQLYRDANAATEEASKVRPVYVRVHDRVLHKLCFKSKKKGIGREDEVTSPYTELGLIHYRDLEEVDIRMYKPCIEECGVTLDRGAARQLANALRRFADGA